MRKQRGVGRIDGMKYSWKGHQDRNRHKKRIERSGQARLVYVTESPWGWKALWKMVLKAGWSPIWGLSLGCQQEQDWNSFLTVSALFQVEGMCNSCLKPCLSSLWHQTQEGPASNLECERENVLRAGIFRQVRFYVGFLANIMILSVCSVFHCFRFRIPWFLRSF